MIIDKNRQFLRVYRGLQKMVSVRAYDFEEKLEVFTGNLKQNFQNFRRNLSEIPKIAN